MKKVLLIIIATLLSVPTIQAQNSTSGTDFWLTFGQNGNMSSSFINLQIRIVSGNNPTEGRIYFTNLDTYVEFNIPAQQVYTYNLNQIEKAAVYNGTMGVSNKSIHITANHQVTVYALNYISPSTDATNLFPVTALGTDYYQISYSLSISINYFKDAYAVVAIENNTQVYHNGILETTLNAGEVYYRTDPYPTDMTGVHITSDKPVALFAVNQRTVINVGNSNHLFQ